MRTDYSLTKASNYFFEVFIGGVLQIIVFVGLYNYNYKTIIEILIIPILIYDIAKIRELFFYRYLLVYDNMAIFRKVTGTERHVELEKIMLVHKTYHNFWVIKTSGRDIVVQNSDINIEGFCSDHNIKLVDEIL